MNVNFVSFETCGFRITLAVGSPRRSSVCMAPAKEEGRCQC